MKEIDWNEDWEEIEPYSIEDIKEYLILYNTNKECIEITKKLKNMGYGIYDYDNIISQSTRGIWTSFIYKINGNYWVQSKRRTDKNFIDFNTFIENY